ncbi:MAG: alpha/beta hydrolase [Candidatus Magnetomorum sp.]|nr:alpha/beta hydrolase [Candidatus Magnetomorum sp.]
MYNEKVSKTLYLRDGRQLGFSDLGDPSGVPLFYFHGFPSSRLEAIAANNIAAELNVRLIAVDRPGIGLSDTKPQRTLLDWPDDVQELADALQIDQFSALGISGGGPYLMACAYKIPQRLISCGSVCGLGPLSASLDLGGMSFVNRMGLTLSKKSPWITSVLMAGISSLINLYPEMIIQLMAGNAPECDKNALKDETFNTIMIKAAQESLRTGSAGLSQDLIIYGNEWGFDLSDIHIPVNVWHGEMDTTLPVCFGKQFEEKIPDCTATYYSNEGHISIVPNHFSDFIETLIAN